MTQTPILTIKFVPAGLDLVIGALRKLPHEQVDPLVQELWMQYKQQMQQIAETTLTAPEQAETEPEQAQPEQQQPKEERAKRK